MKIKELQKTVNITWSPAQLSSIYLAAGTAAQQIDVSINSQATLELYSINLADPGYDLVLKGSQVSPYRFHKVVWSPLGYNGTHPSGIIAAGCEAGQLQVYSASKLLAGEDALIASQDKHTGPVRALDYNPFQANLLASGASESDILIWDLNNTTTPMTPGTKTQPLEDIQNIAWNRQVQHILASVFSTRCIIWDLRKNEPIIKLSDSQSRVRFHALQWHPDVATQLWLASEDDSSPVVQLWDLRYATAPAKTLQIHQRGILGLTWCPHDTDLMVSCAKDNKILCWNPNAEHQGEEILSEVASPIQWYSDVQWCPRNPALIASSSLEGNVSIYSIFGGSQQQVQTTNKIADSFPGMDAFAQVPVPQHTQTQLVSTDPRKPPKWIKRPVGAKFGFGGKLITFRKEAENGPRVTINQVITEPELVARSNKLEDVLANGNFVDFCRQKADETDDQHNRYVWYFLKANFEQDPRSEMLNLLGYNKDDCNSKFGQIVEREQTKSVKVITNKLADLGRSFSSTTNDSTDTSSADNAGVFDSIGDHNKTLSDDGNEEIPYRIRTGDDNEGLICQALLTGNIEAAVELCFVSGRNADAIIIANTGGPELLARAQYRYLKKSDGYLSNIISALVTDDWTTVIAQCTTDSWKEALVATLTHCRDHAPVLCEQLGERLQTEGVNQLSLVQSAILCYICAGNVERLAETWLTTHSQADGPSTGLPSSTKELQDLIEVVILFQKALELQGRNVNVSGKLADLLSQYAGLLAAQGALSSALTYLGPSDDPDIVDLRERLYYALGHKQAYVQKGRTLSHNQNIYSQVQGPTANKFQRTSLPSNNFNATPTSTIAPPATVPFNSGFTNSIQQQPSTPQLWNTAAVTQSPSNAWNAPPQTTPNVNPLLPSMQSKPPGDAGLPPQPPRPSSVSSQSGCVPSSRSKYILDPSVQSGPAYGQSAPMYAPPAPTQFNNQPYGAAAPTNNYNQFTPQPFASAGAQFNQTPFQPYNQSSTQSAGPPSILNPPVQNNLLSGVPPIELGQPAIAQQVQRNPTPPPGWNDPPPLTKSTRQSSYGPATVLCENMSAIHAGTKQWGKIIRMHLEQQHNQIIANASTTTTPSAAHSNVHATKQPAQPKPQETPGNVITHPLFANDPNQLGSQNGYGDSSNPGVPYPGTYMTPTSPQQVPPPTANHAYQPTQFQTQSLVQQQSTFGSSPVGQAPAPQQARQAPTPEPPKQKQPLPEEYVYLQTVFNELRIQCINHANNPQTKRKLDDVAKRFECLYDLLRERRLTPNTLASLNELVQLVQIGDYANGLGLHTQMVSGPDFAQIASFMPGIKVLLQTAMQLQVYLR